MRPRVNYSKIQLPKLIPDGTKSMGLPPPDDYLDRTKRNHGEEKHLKKLELEFISSCKIMPLLPNTSNIKSQREDLHQTCPGNTSTKYDDYKVDPVLNYEKEEDVDDYYTELDFSDNSNDDFIYNSDDDDDERMLEKGKTPEEKTMSNASEACDGASGYNHELGTVPEVENVSDQPSLVSSRISAHVKNNLAILISENKHGIWCSKLLECYR